MQAKKASDAHRSQHKAPPVTEKQSAMKPAAQSEQEAQTPLSPPLGKLFSPQDLAKNMTQKGDGVSLMQARMQQKPSFESAFLSVIGPQALEDLVASFSTNPVVLIAGDQATGKSTVAFKIAQAVAGGAEAFTSGTGDIVRAAAGRAGMKVQDFVKTIPTEMDTRFDYDACMLIGRGDVHSFQSRLAGHIGAFLRKLGRKNLITVYLAASPKEQGLRYVNREISPAAREELEKLLPAKKHLGFADVLQGLAQLSDPKAQTLLKDQRGIVARDQVDRERLRDIYGVDYTDRAVFDVVVDTDGKTPAEVEQEILARVTAHLDDSKH